MKQLSKVPLESFLWNDPIVTMLVCVALTALQHSAHQRIATAQQTSHQNFITAPWFCDFTTGTWVLMHYFVWKGKKQKTTQTKTHKFHREWDRELFSLLKGVERILGCLICNQHRSRENAEVSDLLKVAESIYKSRTSRAPAHAYG